MEYSFLFSKSSFATNAAIRITMATIARYIEGAYRSEVGEPASVATGMIRSTPEVINAIQIFMESDDIESGIVRLYRLAQS